MQKRIIFVLLPILLFCFSGCVAKQEDSSRLTDTEIQEILSTVVGGEEVLLSAGEKYFANLSTDNNNIISPQELHEGIKSNNQEFYIIDIRQNEDYLKSHVPGAVNHFWFDLGRVLEELPKDKHIIVYCYSGQSAGQVVGVLNTIGFKASSIAGGWNSGWVSAGLPVN